MNPLYPHYAAIDRSIDFIAHHFVRWCHSLLGISNRGASTIMIMAGIITVCIGCRPIVVVGPVVHSNIAASALAMIFCGFHLLLYLCLRIYWKNAGDGDIRPREGITVAMLQSTSGILGVAIVIAAFGIQNTLWLGISFLFMSITCACALCEPPTGKTLYQRAKAVIGRLSFSISPSPHPGTA